MLDDVTTMSEIIEKLNIIDHKEKRAMNRKIQRACEAEKITARKSGTSWIMNKKSVEDYLGVKIWKEM
ncbi:hypothetical protein HZI73_26310 (plasmid) [Vallitalea pronyensis]|uniref:Uncharacterized protein n=1 Tax=Vallitalea pronyensis TaxID=1348613 RepID=A0A8J8MQN4_9FIRM|nr:hypothetical protein [Vallitalea pronyensis]QUI25929.1 hypothetical protein HZI73_26310 [Vallitalea pronyensis]